MRSTTSPSKFALVAAAAIVLGACGDRSGKTLEDPVFPPPAPVVVSSSLPGEPATSLAAGPFSLVAPWVDGAEVPARNTCSAEGLSPALTWSNVPFGTVELTIAVTDVDASDTVHWLLYAIPPAQPGLVEGQLPDGSFTWLNSFGRTEWTAPCPPPGETHRFLFTIHALNQQLEVADDADANEVLANLDAITIARSSVSGLVTGN